MDRLPMDANERNPNPLASQQLQEVLRSLGAGKEKLGGIESLLAAAVIDERILRVRDSVAELTFDVTRPA